MERSLAALLLGSVLVGEEGVHAGPGRLAALRGDAPVWIVDPVDGTRQFVRGEPGFCMLVALAHRGEVLASWTYLPAKDVMAVARRGGGAYVVGGEELHAGVSEPGRELEVAVSHHDFTTDAEKRAVARGSGLEPDGQLMRYYVWTVRCSTDGWALSCC